VLKLTEREASAPKYRLALARVSQKSFRNILGWVEMRHFEVNLKEFTAFGPDASASSPSGDPDRLS
jgi:hypothetical protein